MNRRNLIKTTGLTLAALVCPVAAQAIKKPKWYNFQMLWKNRGYSYPFKNKSNPYKFAEMIEFGQYKWPEFYLFIDGRPVEISFQKVKELFGFTDIEPNILSYYCFPYPGLPDYRKKIVLDSNKREISFHWKFRQFPVKYFNHKLVRSL